MTDDIIKKFGLCMDIATEPLSSMKLDASKPSIMVTTTHTDANNNSYRLHLDFGAPPANAGDVEKAKAILQEGAVDCAKNLNLQGSRIETTRHLSPRTTV